MKSKLFHIMIPILFSSPSFAVDTYKVSTSVSLDGNTLISDVVFLEEGGYLSTSIGDDFNYNLTIEPENSKKINISSDIRVGRTFFHPKMVVLYDQVASMQMGDEKK
ncbi:hypothetical protein EA004_25545 [Vibrio anguillarum]|uniref:hypothetical protein n=6 Tax=Vibrio anguillarum TaxID=55601 RepID=UPI00188B6AAC|nr:hypothetical protein [Vibrio anguillarum]MBF4248312.1 hypothetical protein [Vibrio anguillarum]MBF4258039.1 hypothetical protein [Vibrio anguillarum]MBF4275622.1 hypothetical protein [Vibrio anguillarum]MBF4298222.1 hypothetical protein [Vibrio anguillarum]MBF4337161.1 hypothetical protein [Vibrio anguillarum]